MRVSKKRDPRKEPFASSISDEERKWIAHKAVVAPLDNSEAESLINDFERAHKKTVAALAQISGTLKDAIDFADAEASASSAQASVSVMLSAYSYLADSGIRARRGWRRGGKGRHDQFSGETANHERWEALREDILRDWSIAKKIPSERRVAMLVASKDPVHPPWETVRGYFKRQKKKVG
jgi:hypothetical protein